MSQENLDDSSAGVNTSPARNQKLKDLENSGTSIEIMTLVCCIKPSDFFWSNSNYFNLKENPHPHYQKMKVSNAIFIRLQKQVTV